MQLFKKWDRTTSVVVPDGYVMLYSNDGISLHLLDSDNNDVELGRGSSGTVDTALSATSTNPVQNKVVTAKFDTKAELNYLLFRIPEIKQDVTYNFKIDFSETDDFSTVMSYTTVANNEYFKAFTGVAMTVLPSTGINYIFSDEQLQLSLEHVPSTYKYFRFHWSNDNGITYGRYGYGSIEASQQIFDISSSSTSDDTIPKNKKISFTSSNSTNVTWNGAVATFTHNMNCIPIASIYDNTMEQALYGVKVVSANTVTVDFNDVSNVTGTWKLILAYGCDYE